MTVQQLMRKFARWHVWVGWAVALPLLMWSITGLIMVARPLTEVRGDALRARSPSSDAAALVFPKLAGRIEGAELVQRVFPTHADHVSQAFAKLDEDEKRSLASICRKLAA